MQAPDFGLFAFGPQATAVGETVSFDYFWLDGQDPPDDCTCEAGAGDEFDGASLDTTKFNAIIRDDPTRYTVQGGQLNATTVNGDIYQTPNGAAAGPFFLQTADHAGADWVIETKVNAIELSGGYEQAGLLARVDDDDYVKFDILSDEGQTALNRIELRSEVGGVDPEPATAALAAPGQQRDGVAAAQQDRLRLQGRVLVRRHDVHGTGGNGAERDGRAVLRPVHARREQRRRHRALRLPRG